MSEINIDPNLVISDLLDQIKKLSGDNAVLRAAMTQLQNPSNDTESPAPIVSNPAED
jgi:hypothetical protein